MFQGTEAARWAGSEERLGDCVDRRRLFEWQPQERAAFKRHGSSLHSRLALVNSDRHLNLSGTITMSLAQVLDE